MYRSRLTRTKSSESSLHIVLRFLTRYSFPFSFLLSSAATPTSYSASPSLYLLCGLQAADHLLKRCCTADPFDLHRRLERDRHKMCQETGKWFPLHKCQERLAGEIAQREGLRCSGACDAVCAQPSSMISPAGSGAAAGLVEPTGHSQAERKAEKEADLAEIVRRSQMHKKAMANVRHSGETEGRSGRAKCMVFSAD